MLKEQSSSNDKVDQTDLVQRLIQQEKLIANLKTSTSWRLTAPLRWLGRVTKRVLHAPIAEQALSQPALKDYTEWISQFDSYSAEVEANLLAQIDGFAIAPLFSLVLPVSHLGGARVDALHACLVSVQAQIYPHWELCVAVDADVTIEVLTLLREYAQADARIHMLVSYSSGTDLLCNQAMTMVNEKSDWVLRLNATDSIAPKALFIAARAINVDEKYQILYADEDVLNAHDVRRDPYFKCDWNHDLHLSHNLIGRFGVYRTGLMQRLGGYSLGMGEAMDFDLTLRSIECVPSEQILHLPYVLFHAREGLPASAGEAMEDGVKALEAHLQRLNISAKAQNIGHGYQVHYAISDAPSGAQPLVSLIIPTRNGLHLIRQCITSILQKTSYQHYEIIIVDNGSDDPATLDYFTSLNSTGKIRVLRIDAPFNYSALNNEAVKLARGELVGLINNDIEVITPDWLGEMVSHALRPGVGAVGARLWFPDNTMQHGGVVLGMLGIAAHAHMRITREQLGYRGRACLTQNFSAVTAACLVIKKSIYEELHGLNQVALTVAFNDVDFCIRVREAGYRNVWTPFAELYHHESASRGYDNTPEKLRRSSKEVSYMYQHWWHQLLYDPAYSPNLTLQGDDFGYAWPPRVQSLQRRMRHHLGIEPMYKRLASLATEQYRVAYFAENTQSSTFRYRAANMMEVLNEPALLGQIQTCAACFFSGDLQHTTYIAERADMLIISRARYDVDMAALVQAFQSQGKRVLFDVDDLVFDTQVIDLIISTTGQTSTDEVLNYWYGVVGRMAQALQLCDGVITTNAFLASKIKQFINLPVTIIPNFANAAQLAVSEPLYRCKSVRRSERNECIKLGYFSGSATHNVDLALISYALEGLMAADARVELVLVGHIDLEQAFGVRFGGYLKGHLADRLAVHPFVDFLSLQGLIADVDFNLVPLLTNDFTHCKSELKYVDAAIVGTRTIASPTYAYAQAIRHGENGYLAADDEWADVLHQAIANRDANNEVHRDMAMAAYQDVQNRFTCKTQRAVIVQALELS
jgi:GT2 family glycosyltransferase